MILFLTPPFVQLNTPYPATPSLVGFLSSRGFDCTQRDLSIEVALEVLRAYGDEFADEAIEILQNPHLPDEAKIGTTAYVAELAVWIRDHIDPDFGFSRYAERLGVAVPDFGLILNRLRRRSPIDRGTLAAMMTATTWMDAGAALAQGFIDGVADPQTYPADSTAVHTVNRKDAEARVRLWLERCHSRKQGKAAAPPAAAQCENPGIPADQLRRRLDLIKPNDR